MSMRTPMQLIWMLAALSLLDFGIHATGARAQYAISGRIATRGIVRRVGDGQFGDANTPPTWVEYDDNDRKYPLCSSPVGTGCVGDLRQAVGVSVGTVDQACATTENVTACKAQIAGARSVMYANKQILYASRRLIAYETDFFTIDPSERGSNVIERCIFDQSALPDGADIDVARARAFVACNTPSMSVNGQLRVWAPIVGAQVEVINFGIYRQGATDYKGYYYIPYRARVNLFEDYDINAVITFGGFEPRTRSAKKYFLSATATSGYIYDPSVFGFTPVPNYSAESGSLGTLYANMPIEAAVLTVQARLVNPSSTQPSVLLTGYSPSGVDDLTTDQGATEYNNQSDNGNIGFLKKISTPALRDSEIYLFRVADGRLVGSRWGMFSTEVASEAIDQNHNGELDPWEAVSDRCAGKACLVASTLIRGPASTYLSYFLNRFNPAATTAPGTADGRIAQAGSFGVEVDYGRGLESGRIPYLREGDQAKVIVINRATGYVGSRLVKMQRVAGGTMSFVPVVPTAADTNGIDVALRPPNLKIRVTRDTKINQGATKSPDAKSYIIGFEGSGLTSDQIIKVQTEWYDADGSALPEDLPGFTGRLAMTVPPEAGSEPIPLPDGGQVALKTTGSAPNGGQQDRTGFFPVAPGKKSVVVQLPQADLSRGHFYIHLDAQPLTRNIDFTGRPPPAGPSFSLNQVCYSSCVDCGVGSTGEASWTCIDSRQGTGAGPGALSQRPAMYVPFLAPKYDQAATLAKQKLQGATAAEPVYEWLYRPEMQFTLFSLQVNQVNLTNSDGSQRNILALPEPASLYSADSMVRALYGIQAPKTPGLEDIDGEARRLGFTLGNQFVDVVYSQEACPEGEACASQKTATIYDPRTVKQSAGTSALSAHDFLALRLVQKGDEANVLWEYAFQDIRAYLTRRQGERISNIPIGEPSQAHAVLQPANSDLERQVRWKLISHDKDVKLEIGESTGKITVAEESAEGFVIIEARVNQQLFTRVRVYVGCQCQTCQSPGGCMLRVGSVDLTFGLGTSEEGLSAGQLYVKNDELDANAYKRESVHFSSMDAFTELVGDSRGIRQVIAPQTFVQVEDITGGYEVRFYPPSVKASDEKDENTGLYPVQLPNSSDPLEGAVAVWRITDPGPDPNGGAKRLRVSEFRDGGAVHRDSDYGWDSAAKTWSLSEGAGARREQRTQQQVGNLRIERVTVTDAAGAIASVIERTYQTFAWGEQLVREVNDPDGIALTTVTAYYEDANDVGSYRQVRYRIEPDGSWVRYGYDDHRRVITETRPWLDGPASPLTALDADSRVTQLQYAPVDPQDIANGAVDETQPGFDRPRVTTERITGNLASLTYLSVRNGASGAIEEVEERCPSASSSFGDGTCLRTVTTYFAQNDGAANSGKVASVVQPNGRMDSYMYDRGSWSGTAFSTGAGSALRTTVTHGTQSSPAGIAYKTTREINIVDALGHAIRDENYIYDGSYALVSFTDREYDAGGHLTKTTRSNGEQELATWGCCAEESATDSRGIRTTYVRDPLQRVQSSTRAGITTTYTYDGQGRTLTTTRSGGSLSLTSGQLYDSIGRIRESHDEAGLITGYDFAASGRISTTTRPGGFTEVAERYLDGQPKSVTGTGVVAQYFTHEVRSDGSRVREMRTARPDSAAFERTFTDMLGRTVRVERPGFSGTIEASTSTYDATGALVRSTTPGLAATLYEHDELGEQIRSGLDVNSNGALDLASDDRISENETAFIAADGGYWQQTTQRVYTAANSSTPKVIGTSRARISGFSGGLVGEQLTADLYGNETRSTVTINPGSASETRVTDTPDSVQNTLAVSVNGRLTSSTSSTGITTTYGYDALGRRNSVTEPRTGAKETHYDSHGRVDYVKDAAGNTTSFEYDATNGRKTAEINALGKHSYFAYEPRGQLLRTWGEVPYPVQYAYDAYGRRTHMFTYREDAGWTSSTWPEAAIGDATQWIYEEATGLLLRKQDAAGKSVAYAYGPGGKLITRTWARPKPGGGALRTSYTFDPNTGELQNVDHNDNTPDVTYAYDRLGRQTTITDGVGSRTFAYDPNTLQLQTESIDGLTPTVLTHYYDPAVVKGRSLGIGLNTAYVVGYGYDLTGHLQGVSWTANGTSDVALYSRIPSSELLAGYSTQSGWSTAYTHEAKRDLKTQVRNSFGTTMVSQYEYEYDALGRRTSMKNSGSAFTQAGFMKSGYDERNQVTTTDRYLGTDVSNVSQPVNTQQRAYVYDPIGNRENSTAASMQTSYTANLLNQYTTVGSASPSYDEDGNLLSDGSKLLVYNAENQLKSAVVQGVSASTYDYDYLGRRVRKSVHMLDGSAPDYSVTWVYNAWNKIEERKAVGPTTTVTNQVWGLDLSQSMDGAGGIGGLLAVVDAVGGEKVVTYDGHGNVSELVRAATGSTLAHYEYDAFGTTITATGPEAAENSYRFSTKYADNETGFVYYGYRYLNVELGRWLQRDPIGEKGGANFYAFVGNDGINLLDALGLKSCRGWLKFDGSTLSWYMSPYPKEAELRWTTAATSGQRIIISRLGIPVGSYRRSFADASKPNIGPIPQGDYDVMIRSAGDATLLSQIYQERDDSGRVVRAYRWLAPAMGLQRIPESLLYDLDNPRTQEDETSYQYEVWGRYRARIVARQGTRTFGRGGFYLHSSNKFAGTHGCIETNGDEYIFLLLKEHAERTHEDRIRLVVRGSEAMADDELSDLRAVNAPEDFD